MIAPELDRRTLVWSGTGQRTLFAVGQDHRGRPGQAASTSSVYHSAAKFAQSGWVSRIMLRFTLKTRSSGGAVQLGDAWISTVYSRASGRSVSRTKTPGRSSFQEPADEP